MTRLSVNLSRAVGQWAAAVIVCVVAIILAATQTWVFGGPPVPIGDSPSLWQIVLSDSITLGFLKLGLMAIGLYVLASVAALVIGGRWIKGFPGGLSADEVVKTSSEGQEALAELKQQVTRLQTERDEARAISRALLEILRG
jgi:hypothetical protein